VTTIDEPDAPALEIAQGDALLRVERLRVHAEAGSGGGRDLIKDLSFEVRPSEVLAIVGESGSGKSTICLSILGLLGTNVAVPEGSIRLGDVDLANAPERTLRRVRGAKIGVVFQDPLASLDPVRSVGSQLIEARIIHGLSRRKEAKLWAQDMLRTLRFAEPKRAMRAYPGTFSGGMRQRICVGIAFSAQPQLVIADEPTTSLDVSLQGRVLRLILDHAADYGTSVILVSHDVSVVRSVSDRVMVMYGGRQLERGTTQRVLNRPASPYTRALLGAIPRIDPEQRGKPLATIGSSTGHVGDNGCPFAGRCPKVLDRCRTEFPHERRVGGDPDHAVWCWNPVEATS
jgi:oligopeptide/dipeptide ABC transporter ATP-binding protein